MTVAWADFLSEHCLAFHIFMLRQHRDCPGNTARMATAGSYRQKPRTVTSEEEIGPKPSPGKFSVTPFWLAPSPDLSLQMAEERSAGSRVINIIQPVFTSANLKMTEQNLPHLWQTKTKTKSFLPTHIRGLHNKSMIRCNILHTKQMTASPCKASRMKLLANEREQVWMSMSAPIKKRTKKKRCRILCWKMTKLLQKKILSLRNFFDWSKWAWLVWIGG